MYSFGYDIHDLNGDGTDELILLSDTYFVYAILTMRNGVPVLLTTIAETIDENGRFCAYQYASDHRYGEQHCLWEITDGRLHTVVCVQMEYDDFNHKRSDTRYYAIAGGRKTAISRDDFLTLCEQTELTPSGYSDKEYTRAVSGLSFNSLLPAAPAALDTTLPFVRTHMSSSARTFTQTDSHTWETEFDFFAPTADDENAYLTLTAVVTEENGSYRFDSNSVRGRIEPISGGFWLIPEEITDSSIVNKPYLYFYELN